MKQEKEEKKIVGTSYLIQMYNEIETLNDLYATYSTLIKGSDENHKKDEDIPEAVATSVKNYSGAIFQLIQKIEVRYLSLLKIIKITKDEELIKATRKVLETTIIDQEKLKAFVIQINSFLTTEIIQEVLKTNRDLYEKILTQKDE